MKNKFIATLFGTVRHTLRLMVVLTLPVVGDLRADSSPASLTIRHNGADFEGYQEFELEWNAISNATYGVQVSTNLESGSWETIDLVTPAGNVGSYRVPPSIRGVVVDKHLFSRLVLPQPQIFAVEPAIFPPGAPVDAYVNGQCFATNDVIRVDGVPVVSMVHLSPNQFQGPLPPMSVGSHLVELVRGGVVKSSFTVVVADALLNPELVLQGPPSEPPATAIVGWLSKRGYDYYKSSSDFASARTGYSAYQALASELQGSAATGVNPNGVIIALDVDLLLANSRRGYDYYKAQSDMNSAALHNNPFFNENQNSGEMPNSSREKTGLNSSGNRGAVIQFDVVNAKKSAQKDLMNISRVLPHSGEVRLESVDLVIPGRGLDFIWARTYNSRIGRSTSPNGWTFSYDLNVQPLGGDILIHNGTGREDRFRSDTNGVYTCPEFFAEGSLSNNIFKLTHADSGYWEFKPLTVSADAGKLAKIVDRNGNTVTLHYDGAGKLTQVVDDLGRTNTVTYNVAGQLESVTDFSGRTVRYEYDGNGDLVSAISPPVIGTPNGNDFPGGKTNRYTYTVGSTTAAENHLLLSRVDALGVTTEQFSYDLNAQSPSYLRCLSAQEWTNPPTVFRYFPHAVNPAQGFSTLRCVVNDPVGNVAAISTDARGRCVKLEEFTGRADPGTTVTNTTSLPITKLRSTDPASYVTAFSWNEDSLCTATTLPDGSREEALHQRAFNQNAARSNNPRSAIHKGDLRVLRQITAPGMAVDFDGDGVADATERAWRFDHDERFGSPDLRSSTSGWYFPIRRMPEHSGNTFDANMHGERRGSKEQIKQLGGMRAAIKDIQVGEVCDDGNTISGDGCNSDCKVTPTLFEDKYVFTINATFETAVTDPRGNVITAEYDAAGNRLARKMIPVTQPDISGAERNFTYNTHGQLTAITNAADANGHRSVTRLEYTVGSFPIRVISDADGSGLRLTNRFEYDSRGNVTRAIDPLGHDWLYTYNALDQCVRVQSPTNITSRCATDLFYDENDNLVTRTTELRDASDNLICGKTQHFRVNPLGLARSIENSVDCSTFMTNDFVYDANGRCILALGGDAVSGADSHQSVSFQYDERGMLYRTVAAPGSPDQTTTQLDFDSNGNPIRVGEGLEGTPSVTTLEYDGFAGSCSGARKSTGTLFRNNSMASRFFACRPGASGQPGTAGIRVSSITDPMGNVTTFNYDANDNLKVIRHFGEANDAPGTNGNILLAQSTLTYDALDRTVKQSDAHFNIVGQTIGDGYRTTSFAYAPNGQCIVITNDLGQITTFHYDTAGRGTNVTSPNQKTSFAVLLNSNGDAEKCIRTDRSDLGGPPQVFTWTNTFDSLGRCVRTVDNVGNTNRYFYDSLSRFVKVIDPKGFASFFEYDLLDRQTIAVTDLNNDGLADSLNDITSSKVWSSTSGRLLASIDSHGNTTSYGYDSLGRTTSITNADNTRFSLVWSPRSNLISETDANGTVITHTYDANDRCVSNNITPGAGVATATTFETFSYDGSSRLIAAVNDVSTCAFAYDSLGNCVSESRNGLATTSTYDALGNRLSLIYPGGRSLTYAYNSLNLCTNIAESSVSLASFDYDSPDRLARISYGNGMRTRINYGGLVGAQNAPDDFGHGQVSRILHAMSGGSPLVSEIKLAWDRNGNKTRRDDAIFAPAITRTNSLALTYDTADRLFRSIKLHGSGADRFDYTLDHVGNRQSVAYINFTNGGVLLPYSMDANNPPADFQMNQYTTTPYDSRMYDACGNLVGRAIGALSFVNYTYDYAHRLVSTIDSGIPVAQYAYDALGRRISKTVFDNGGGPTVTTEFFYDGDEVIEARTGALIDSFVHRVDDGITLAMRRSGQDYFFHTDDQGNTLALTTTGGAVVERYDYDDYGAVTFLTSDGTPTGATHSAVGNPYLLQGMEWDNETGLHHNGSADYGVALYKAKAGKSGKAKQALRYADPSTGRGIECEGGELGDSNPWSQVLNTKKLSIKLSFSSAGKDNVSAKGSGNRRVTVNGSGAGLSAVKSHLHYRAKQGKSGSTSGK